jgi:sulfur-oxidizing protein SoxB
MQLTRREFLQALACASAAGLWAPSGTLHAKSLKSADDYYDVPKYGNVSFLHFTDCHAQLLPSYYREPAMHMGTGQMKGKVPHLVGKHFLKQFNIPRKSREAYALSYLDFEELSQKFGAMGGFAQLATLVKRLRTTRPQALLLDGGDTWQGSATSLWTNAQDIFDAT